MRHVTVKPRHTASGARAGTAGPAMIAFVGRSNSGKTTLVSALIAEFVRRGVRVGAVKHSRRDFTLDVEGKDTDRFRKAGAESVLAVSPRCVALVSDAPPRFSPRDAAALFPRAEIVLVEGWKESGLPKVAVAGGGTQPRAGNVIATVGSGKARGRVPRFDQGDVRGIADFILAFAGLPRHATK